ncbi:hypothetical protein LTR16_000966 [Cryomyces antarcticus]|uniref:Altered inheritance of mitochondria protein 9, mitochondrial n=1 Tax=Cryomyces antarcticus TaxID=329879 RepID=A0ABR0LQM7_9PEZI|nr:hypothetical protein LTR60_003509 [Cryomyces antarcticus]KAK5201929.1 hypothetical protein LTR16_000966 [Cryomyces antarcticus]
MTMDNGGKIVARLPSRIAGPRKLTTNSEVATMTYLKTFTSIPVPKILDWSDDDSNPIGAEYIIMENVAGVRLHERWTSMNTPEHMQCTKALSLLVKKMVQIDFPAYGSLYFTDAIEPGLRVEFAEGYCVGPHCGSQYWNCDPGEKDLYGDRNTNHGPWKTLPSYCTGLVQTGCARLPKMESEEQSPYRGSVNEHLRLLRISEAVIEELAKSPLVQRAAAPILFHNDFHKRNVFVSDEDPTVVTAIIDWQATSIEPAFIFANEHPDFAELPDDVSFLGDGKEETKEEIKLKEDASICAQTFEVCIRGYAPKLWAARALDATLFRPFRYCHTSWRDGAAAVQQELIEVSQQWTKLGLPGPCPYQPTEEELTGHKKQYQDFEDAHKMRLAVMRTLDVSSDGWVQTDRWEEVAPAHQRMYEMWLDSVKESLASGEDELTLDQAKEMWPFDGVEDVNPPMYAEVPANHFSSKAPSSSEPVGENIV